MELLLVHFKGMLFRLPTRQRILTIQGFWFAVRERGVQVIEENLFTFPGGKGKGTASMGNLISVNRPSLPLRVMFVRHEQVQMTQLGNTYTSEQAVMMESGIPNTSAPAPAVQLLESLDREEAIREVAEEVAKVARDCSSKIFLGTIFGKGLPHFSSSGYLNMSLDIALPLVSAVFVCSLVTWLLLVQKRLQGSSSSWPSTRSLMTSARWSYCGVVAIAILITLGAVTALF